MPTACVRFFLNNLLLHMYKKMFDHLPYTFCKMNYQTEACELKSLSPA